MIRISKLAASVQPSATLAAGAKAKELKNRGITVFDFSLGEPDFDTPAHICDAAYQAMRRGETHYTPASGTLEVRRAIAGWYARTYGYEFGPECVVVSNGAKHSIHNTLAASVGPGDEVIIPAPYWVSYSDLVAMTGAKPVVVVTEMAANFKMTLEQLKTAITPQTRLLMLNSPCNPTGTVYTQDELVALAEHFLTHTDGAILSDEIYEQLVYGEAKPTCLANVKPGWRDRIITISGASKSYAMTGWRMGWAIAPAPFAKAMDTIQSQETSCPSSVSQAALITALESPETEACLRTMLDEFAIRRDLACNRLQKMPGVQLPIPDGAFYAYFRIADHFGKSFGGKTVTDSLSFCAALLEQAHVNLIPGIAFGTEGFARMSFATSRAVIEAGLTRLEEWLATADA